LHIKSDSTELFLNSETGTGTTTSAAETWEGERGRALLGTPAKIRESGKGEKRRRRRNWSISMIQQTKTGLGYDGKDDHVFCDS